MITVKIYGPSVDNKSKLALTKIINDLLKRKGFTKIIVSREDQHDIAKLGSGCKELMNIRNIPVNLKMTKTPKPSHDQFNTDVDIDIARIFNDLNNRIGNNLPF